MSIATLLRGVSRKRPEPVVVYDPYPAAVAVPATPAAPEAVASSSPASRRRAHWSVALERVTVPDEDLYFV